MNILCDELHLINILNLIHVLILKLKDGNLLYTQKMLIFVLFLINIKFTK